MKDAPLTLAVLFLISFSILILNSVAPSLFPLYFVYIALGLIVYFVFSLIDFEIISLFSKHLYVVSIILLILPLLIGQVTRGAIRWIPIGPLTIQPAEIVRPFLLVFFANYLTGKSINGKTLLKAFILLALPLFLILVQPSLGVTALVAVSFFGVLLASELNKKHILAAVVIFTVCIPLLWFVLAPYQKVRITAFLDPTKDPLGIGYNSIQSMISVGSGKLTGRGLGRGVQTQLSFLPERHSDFIFASVTEELGLFGAILLMSGIFTLLLRLTSFMEHSVSPAARAYLAGLLLTLTAQSFVHIGMNMGLLPITGLPLPLVSAGGSSLLSIMMGLGIALGARKR